MKIVKQQDDQDGNGPRCTVLLNVQEQEMEDKQLVWKLVNVLKLTKEQRNDIYTRCSYVYRRPGKQNPNNIYAHIEIGYWSYWQTIPTSGWVPHCVWVRGDRERPIKR